MDIQVFNNGLNLDALQKLIDERDRQIEICTVISNNIEELKKDVDENCIFPLFFHYRSSISFEKTHSLEQTICNFDNHMWFKLFDNQYIRSIMTASEYTNIIQRFRNNNIKEYLPFTFENVKKMISSIDNNSQFLFAQKIKNVFENLSHEFKSNQGNTLPPYIALTASYSTFDMWHYRINEFYSAICTIENIEYNKINQHDFETGEWVSLCNDAFRLKRFNNENVHIHISNDLYEKIVLILSNLNINVLSLNESKQKRKPYVRK